MKLINIYLVGLFYVLKPTKYMVWNNEIISWGLCLLCMDAWCMLLDIEDIGTGIVKECCGKNWGLYMVLLLLVV